MICIVVCIEMWLKRVYLFSDTPLLSHYQQVISSTFTHKQKKITQVWYKCYK